MNSQQIVNKFIEKCGPLDPLPEKHFIQNTAEGGRFGLTTELPKVIDLWRNKSLKDYGKLPSLKVSPGLDILPQLHVEANGFSFDWLQSDLLKAMRILQNHPFSKVSCFHSPEPMPIAFKRNDSEICVLLAPYVLPIKNIETSTSKIRKNPWIVTDKDQWILKSNLPNCTFQLFELDCVANGYGPNTVLAMTSGYPIAKLLMCSKCHASLTITDWTNRFVNQNHPECVCSCDTYGDECGCRRAREFSQFDRIRRESTIKMRFTKKALM